LATQEIKDLLLEAGPFARLSAMEQQFRLVRYYQPWFAPGWKPDTINNIRATQRLVTHAKAMNTPVGTVLMVILEEASGLSATQPVSAVSTDTHVSGRGLLDVEADQATYFEEEPAETVPAVTDMVVTVGDATPEPMADTPTPPAQGGPKTRSSGIGLAAPGPYISRALGVWHPCR